jgi:membrane associated rhomboid family serine protease
MNTILIAIILANVLFSFKEFNDIVFFRKYEFHMGSVRSGDQIRILSSGFLHADFSHLIF